MIPAVTLLIILGGCQWLARGDAARRYEAARLDDRTCREQGYRWPGEAYVDCRRFRADARQRERWQEMQLANRDASDLAISTDTYRPIRAENFACRLHTVADGETFIDCRETP